MFSLPPEREFKHILFEIQDGVATILLNHPERLNALDHGPGSMHEELTEAVSLADQDSAIRCVIVRGSGRAFSSGGFLPPGSGNAHDAASYYRFLSIEDAANERLRASRKPMFAAVHGVCYGAALIMALHLDFIIAAESARLGFIETRFGSTGIEVLTYFVGPQWAKFLALSGELIGARRAAQIGLILQAVPDADFDRSVADLARRMAAMPTPASMMNKQVLNGSLEGWGWSHQKAMAKGMNSVTNSVRGVAADGRPFHEIRGTEGLAAFKAARDAPFQDPWLRD